MVNAIVIKESEYELTLSMFDQKEFTYSYSLFLCAKYSSINFLILSVRPGT